MKTRIASAALSLVLWFGFSLEPPEVFHQLMAAQVSLKLRPREIESAQNPMFV